MDSLAGPLPPGEAVDLAAGEGRHALWLAGRGWRVTAVDFSAVGLERGREQAAAAGVPGVTWEVADVRTSVVYEHLRNDRIGPAPKPTRRSR